jgi:hypothetical protein
MAWGEILMFSLSYKTASLADFVGVSTSIFGKYETGEKKILTLGRVRSLLRQARRQPPSATNKNTTPTPTHTTQ